MISWGKGYAVCGMLIVFGLFPQIVGSSTKDVTAKESALVARGLRAPARVTKKWESGRRSTQYDVEYAFRVENRDYEGHGVVGAQEYLRLQPGSEMEVFYLREDPSISAFQPQLSLDNARRTEFIGWLFVGGGLAALLVVAALDVRRHLSPNLAASASTGAQTYRSPIFFYFVAAIFFAAGAFFQAQILLSIVKGDPIPVTTSINGHSTTGYASASGMVGLAVFPAAFWGIGLFMILYCKGYTVTTSNEGIAITKFPGKLFSWRWDEITQAKRMVQSGGTQYVIGDKDRKTWVTTVQNNGALATELESRLGPLMDRRS